MINILGFGICASIIFFGGGKLSYYGDQIAEKSGLGKAWLGLILMATVTSLPELIVGISSSAIIKSADLAVGDVIGSCAFNMAILAILDIFVPKHQHLFFIASGQRHILSASLGLILMAVAGLGLFLPLNFIVLPGLGIISLFFIIVYFASVRIIYQYDFIQKKGESILPQVSNEKSLSLKQLYLQYFFYAVIVIAAAMFIPYFAEKIASYTGLGNTFVGTFLVAASTSLPEVAVSIAAVRMGSVDLAIGNLLGSNIFNMLILAIDDLFYSDGILLKDASDIHLISVFSVVLMASIAIAGFTYQSPKKKFLMAFDALLMLGVFIFSMTIMYVLAK